MTDTDQAIATLLTTTSSGQRMVKKYGPDWTKWPASSEWYQGLSLLEPPTPPPPPPPPVTGTPPMPFYSAAWSGYSAIWDQIVAAGMPKTGGLMGPLDPSVVTHVGVKGQWLLIPNGYTTAQIQQYVPPCWQTGLVAGFVVYDEPSASQASMVSSLSTLVKQLCPGVRTATTGYDAGTLAALVSADCADLYLVDNYPSRTGWDLASLKQCVAAVQSKPFGIVLDAFTATNYPLPTPAQLQSEIDYALTTNAELLPVYQWPVDPSLQPVLKAYA